MRTSRGISLGIVPAIIAFAAVSSCAAPEPQAEFAAQPEVVREVGGVDTAYGKLVGEIVENEGYAAFRGIPFAAPPVGDLRWAPPAAPASWEGERDASEFGPSCAQTTPKPGDWNYDPDVEYSEDCLYLNVYAPLGALDDEAEPLPVMFWIYGGGFSRGGASQAVYRDPTEYTDRGVILVIPNYRLGALGYLAHPDFTAKSGNGMSGNYGTMDQIAALEWVQENIAEFGGDPANVTLFGESAGAISNNVLMVTPSAQALFDKAIMQSGGIWGLTPYMKSLSEAEAWGKSFLERHGAKTLEEARALDTATLAELPWEYAYSLQPIADGVVTPATTGDAFLRGEQSAQPIIIGWTRDEAGRMHSGIETEEAARDWFNKEFGNDGPGLFEEYFEVHGDYTAAVVAAASNGIGQGSLVEAALHLEKTPNVFAFRFDQAQPTEDGQKYGAVHGADVPYTFAHFFDGADWRESDKALSTALIDYWVSFAKTGNPNLEGHPEWPAFNLESPTVMSFGDPVQPVSVENYDLFMRTMKTENFSRDDALKAEQ